MQPGPCAARIVGLAFLCAAFLAITSTASAQLTPNNVQCSITPQGVMSCTSFNGWTCSGTAYQKTCSPGGHYNVTCTESPRGIISCSGAGPCYSENGTSKCYSDTTSPSTTSSSSL